MSDEQSKLLLLGVGGGGGRLAAAVRARYADEMRMLCMDTDALANREIQQVAPDIPCVLFGGGRLAGNGAGGDPVKGREAFKDDGALLEPHLLGVRTAVILACLGAGTGGGATAEVANLLKQKGISTLCIVTRPFSFEGQARQNAANLGCSQIATHANALVEVALDDLFEEGGGQQTLTAAIATANRMLASGVTLLWRMMSRPGFICTDPERLHNLVMHGKDASFGSAVAAGGDRVNQLMDRLQSSRLLRGREMLGKAGAILVGILGGDDVRLAEIGGIMNTLREWLHAECHVEMGTVLDPAFDGRLELVVFAFQNWAFPTAKPPDTSADPNMWGDQNLDEPTFRRLQIRLER